ncbi:hypothetical protein [Undibacterium sp. TJN19]|uniref:hypothetical protein n=1 Tax=Undibacterium sp. TJN19 TaxID=3413055 RepID=UPI003BF31B52
MLTSKSFVKLILTTAAFAYTCTVTGADKSPVLAKQSDPLALCRLPEMGIRSDVGLGFPRITNRLPTLGDVRITVLFVDFSDVPATATPQQVMSIISPEAEKYFDAVSYGKMHLRLLPSYQWLRMGKSSVDYHFGRGASFETQRSYLQEAVNRAGKGIDYSQTDAVLVIANPAVKAIDWGPAFTARPGLGIQAGGREILNGATSGGDLNILGWSWFNHEFGHVMSLVDLAGPLPSTQEWHTYVGDFSVMGNPAGKGRELLGWERWQLGWLADSQVLCANTAQLQARLSPIERRADTDGSSKIIIVPTGKTTAIIVESRRAEGYDSSIPQPGPLVYTIDTRLSSHDGAIRIQPVNDKDTRHLQATMKPGQVIWVGKTTIRFVSTDVSGDLMHVETDGF